MNIENSLLKLIHADSKDFEKIDESIKKIGKEFDNALENNFNTHLALSAFFQLIKEGNRLAAEEKLGKDDAENIKTEMMRMMMILGVVIPEITENEKQEINELIRNREKVRKEKKFEEADKIRDRLNEIGVELIDHKERTIWMKKEKIRAGN